MNNSRSEDGDSDSRNSFGEYRPQSEGNATRHGITNTTQHTSPAPEPREENKEASSSSDTANFHSSQPQNLSFDRDFVPPAPLVPLRLAEVYSAREHAGSRSDSMDSGSLGQYEQPRVVLQSPEPMLPMRYALPLEERSPPSEAEHAPLFGERAGEILDDILGLVSTETARLLDTKTVFKKQKQSFDEYLAEQRGKIAAEKEQWEKNARLAREALHAEKEVVELDIGGTHSVTTTIKTLCKAEGSALAAMFSGRHKLSMHGGKVFIDRDGEAFCMVLSYLRNNKLPKFLSRGQEETFYDELKYWLIPVLNPPPLPPVGISEFDPNWCAGTLRLENGYSTVAKHGPQHGVVFCKQPLGRDRNYVEFRVRSQDPVLGRSSLFIGAVDRSKYRPEQLVSTFWKDSPSSFYCDVGNNKLIRIDERGCQTGVAAGYGCRCQETEVTYFGIEYDEKAGTLGFYKNGLFQGVAFHSVPSGLYPAVDLWFELGQVDLVTRPPSENSLQLGQALLLQICIVKYCYSL